ncbi:MAG: redoxin domain-containing protein [Acidobacteria bacterium]|nr:redoxin domain-containing protein [Acidobacteriota bacterium]
MGPHLSTRIFFAAVLVLGAALSGVAQQPEPDAARLRALYFQRNYETGVLEGAKLISAAPDRPAVKAWYALNLSRAGREDDAVAAAREMTARWPQDGWSWVALGGALIYKGGHLKEAADAGAKALELMPGHLDAVWIRGQTLANDPARRQEAIDFVDRYRARVSNPAQILLTKAYALYVMAFGPPRNDAGMNAAFAVFEEAQRLDPTNVNAFYTHGTYLESQRRGDEGYPLVKKAVSLSPDATSVRQAYWTAIKNSRQMDAERKRQEIETDVAHFMKNNGDRPGALRAVSSISREMKFTERQREAEERLLSKFLDSPDAEWVLVDRWRAVNQQSDSGKLERRRLVTEYVARPRHYHTGLLGEAYRNLFFLLVEDKTVPEEELLHVMKGMVKYETTNTHITHAAAPVALADRKILLGEAERVARESLDAFRKKADSQRPSYKSAGEYEEGRDWMLSLGHDALGWVLFAQGRHAEAEKELLRSYELHREGRGTLHHLGKFFEAKGDIARAEDYYVKGLGVQGPGINPSEASLRALFEKKHGNAEGFDPYISGLRERDRVARRDKILGQRIATPATPAAFSLKSMDGKRVALADLKGKIVVINFWGIWCGWCVKEMPDLQKLHTQYANDPDVVILTIDNDKNPDDVPPWMKERKYTFPVLFDDGYVSKAEIYAFPTTWFLDREGRKVFEKSGWSEKLVEEFAWRIEAIRGTATSAGR